MSGHARLVLTAASLAIVLGMSGVAFQMAKSAPLPRPTLGTRGLERSRALQAGGVFRIIEPLIRFTGSWLQGLSWKSARSSSRHALLRAGDYLGLSDDEFFAVSLLSALGAGIAAVGGAHVFGWPSLAILLAGMVGALGPWFRLRSLGRERARRVDRSLPGVLELAAMCMSAGLDFPGSLRRIVSSAPDEREPIIEELSKVLRELEFGHTRRSALANLADRVPTDQVRELTSAIVQAEQKGSPLGPVLAIQAHTQRLRRSLAAEEVASGAALMLIGPMTLIFLCVIVLLLGPVVVRLMSGGLGIS